MKKTLTLEVDVRENGAVDCDGVHFGPSSNIAKFIMEHITEQEKRERFPSLANGDQETPEQQAALDAFFVRERYRTI